MTKKSFLEGGVFSVHREFEGQPKISLPVGYSGRTRAVRNIRKCIDCTIWPNRLNIASICDLEQTSSHASLWHPHRPRRNRPCSLKIVLSFEFLHKFQFFVENGTSIFEFCTKVNKHAYFRQKFLLQTKIVIFYQKFNIRSQFLTNIPFLPKISSLDQNIWFLTKTSIFGENFYLVQKLV